MFARRSPARCPASSQASRKRLPKLSLVSGLPLAPQMKVTSPVGSASSVLASTGKTGTTAVTRRRSSPWEEHGRRRCAHAGGRSARHRPGAVGLDHRWRDFGRMAGKSGNNSDCRHLCAGVLFRAAVMAPRPRLLPRSRHYYLNILLSTACPTLTGSTVSNADT